MAENPLIEINLNKDESSFVEKMRYNLDTEQLDVGFKNNKEYSYNKVPLVIFEKFRDAESKGKFLHKNLKGVYDGQSNN